MSADETLHRFFDLDDAGRWSFDCKDGVHVEGYALDVEEHRVLFGCGGPLAQEEPRWIDFVSIDTLALHYWSERARRWCASHPRDERVTLRPASSLRPGISAELQSRWKRASSPAGAFVP